jgi:LysM repeat protein
MSRSTRKRKPTPGLAHYGAPAAFLAAVTIAVLLVHSAFNGGSSTTTATTAPHATAAATTTRPKKHAAPAKRFYTVQTGDTFGSIAAKEGITVEQLQSLNPGVSSNALQVGQKLRIK